MARSAGVGEDDAREYLLRKLTAAPASSQQCLTALGRRGFTEEVSRRVVDRFEELGLINDAEYADMLVRTKHRQGGKARRAIAADLRGAGVDDVTAQAALDQVDDVDESGAARALVAKKLPSLLRHPDDVIVRRLAGQLGRRGYSGELSYGIITEALAEARAGGADGS